MAKEEQIQKIVAEAKELGNKTDTKSIIKANELFNEFINIDGIGDIGLMNYGKGNYGKDYDLFSLDGYFEDDFIDIFNGSEIKKNLNELMVILKLTIDGFGVKDYRDLRNQYILINYKNVKKSKNITGNSLVEIIKYNI